MKHVLHMRNLRNDTDIRGIREMICACRRIVTHRQDGD